MWRITLSASLLILAFSGHFISKTQRGLLLFFTFLFLGLLLHLPETPQGFYSESATGDTLIMELTSKPEAKPKSRAAEARVLGRISYGNTSQSEGLIQLYIEPNDAGTSLKKGSIISGRVRYDSIVHDTDTGFNAAVYFAQKDIYHRAYLSGKDWWKSGFRERRGRLERWRDHAKQTIKCWGMHPHSEQVMTALVLGDKRELDPILRQQYADAGVVHVLAVSGLHVGVIYLLVSLLLGFFIPVRYAFTKSLIVILFLWFYAFLTGLSPSVWRAATMFSLLTVGRNLGRITGIYHTIATSAILLLILEPRLLFQPGFQLSYAAVFGIVRYQPQIAGWWIPRHRWINSVWQLLTVSLAAQMITLPFTSYYFGQFPTYFLLANLLIIPLLSTIMIASISILVMGIITNLPHWFTSILDWAFHLENTIVRNITEWPYAVINDLNTSLPQAIIVMMLLLSLMESLRRRHAGWLMFTLLSCIIVVGIA